MTHGHWKGIHHLSSAQFEDLAEIIFLLLKAFLERSQGIGQVSDLIYGSDTNGRRVYIVGGLGHIHIIEGMDMVISTMLFSQGLQGFVGNDLVHVHIGRGTGTTLEGVGYEGITSVFQEKEITGCHNGIGFFCCQKATGLIGHGTGFFYGDHGGDQIRMDGSAGTMEIIGGPCCMYAV